MSKVKHVAFAREFIVPASEGVTIVDGHPIGHVIVLVGLRSDVGLMVVGVEQMRKVPFFEFGEPEGFRELGQLHLKEGHGIDETDTGRQTLELEDFTPVTDLTQFETELMQRVDDGITVVPLEIMSKDGQRLFTALTPVLQLEQKLLDARVTVPPMEDVVVGALADQEVRHVSAIDLFGSMSKNT